jgi:hypothetical protein
MHELSIRFEKGHLFVDINGDDWLLDTGAPTSFGIKKILMGDHDFPISESYMGLSAGQLSDYVDHSAAGILGSDILNTFDLFIDLGNERLSFTREETSFEGEILRMTDFMGIPVIQARIGDLDRKMFFDTGARISYFQDKSLDTYPSLGTVTDFYPGFGDFQTETYRVGATIGAIRFELCCGTLPGMLGTTLPMAGVDGIIGNEILGDHILGYFPRRQTLVFV